MTADLCFYTEYRIYPGTGQRYYAKDGKVSFFFIGKKAESLFHQRIKPVKLHRTQAWRHMNKKGMANEQVKKRIRKSQKFQKAIVGLKIEDLVLPVSRETLQQYKVSCVIKKDLVKKCLEMITENAELPDYERIHGKFEKCLEPDVHEGGAERYYNYTGESFRSCIHFSEISARRASPT